MLKSFIKHIQDTTQPLIHTIDPDIDSGSTFVVASNGEAVELRPVIDHPDTLPLHSLEALVKMVQTEAASVGEPLYITIPDHLTVRCFGQPQPDDRFFRQFYKVVYNDNGIATTVTTQKGVALQSNEQIRPIITLKPYRTFQEVEQPESIFLIRVNERGITFTEADGGMWKLKVRQTVKAFLEAELESLVSSEAVFIAL